MSRCTLCGGKLTLNGKCSECGLDNKKNDKKYRLNVHNEKGMRLHYGDCDENLNQERGRQKKPGKEAERYDKRASRSQSAKTAELARTEKKAKQRSQTGTVKKKKKGGCLGWIVLIFAVLGALGDLSGNIFYEIERFIEENFQSPQPEPVAEVAYEQVVPVETAEAGEQTVPVETERPAAVLISPVDWNEDVDQYYTVSLEAGIYTGGYDIPAGYYQLTCTGGNTYVYWWNPEAQEGGHATLYSETDQIAYEAELGEACEFSQYSEMFELEEGGILYVEVPAELTIAGHKSSPLELKERKAQGLSGEVLLDNNTDTVLIAGENFEAGTYDVVAEGGGGVFMDIDRNGSYYYISLGAGEVFYRFPFADGTKLELNLFGDAEVYLKPSY